MPLRLCCRALRMTTRWGDEGITVKNNRYPRPGVRGEGAWPPDTWLWVVARHVHPGVRWRDMVIAGGMSAWAAYLTPFQTGAGPTMMWVMRRAGVRLPEAMTSTFMTFVATVAFFALAGPLAIYL